MPRPKRTESEAGDAVRVRLAKNTQNVTLDRESADLLREEAEKLKDKFGFQPTLSQALSHIIFAFRKGES